jgi:hypothetical protein
MSTPREKNDLNDPLFDAIERAAEYGGGPVLHIPERAHIQLSEDGEHLLEGAIITYWYED